jgi:hypothetical protein
MTLSEPDMPMTLSAIVADGSMQVDAGGAGLRVGVRDFRARLSVR